MAVFCDGGSKDLWNVGKLLPDYTALQPRRQPSSYSPPWEPQILPSKSVCYIFYTLTLFITFISVLTWCQTFKIPAVMYVCYTRNYEVNSDSVKLFLQLFSKLPFKLLKEKPNFTNKLCGGPEISSTLYMWPSLNMPPLHEVLFVQIYIHHLHNKQFL
jgi:hypothetical protein